MPDFPARGTEIARALYALNPRLTTGSDDQQRLFVKTVAEQMAYELGPAYGVKSAGVGRPQGPSQIAFAGGTEFGGWRIIDNDGSQSGMKGGIIPQPIWQLFPNQLFLAVDPVDHLKVSDTRPPPRSDPPAPPVDLAPLLARIDALERLVQPLADQWTALQHDVAVLLSRIDQRYVTIDLPFRFKAVSLPETVVQRLERQKNLTPK